MGSETHSRIAPAPSPVLVREQLDGVYSGIAGEMQAAGYDLDAGQIRWIVQEAQRRTAKLMGRACMASGRIRG